MGHVVGRALTAKNCHCHKNMIFLTAKNRQLSRKYDRSHCEKCRVLCQSEDLKVTIVLMCMPNIYPQVQTFHQSVSLDCWALCFSVLRLGTGDMFFLRRMLKAMVEKALEEALHDKVA